MYVDSIARLADSVITRIWPDKSERDRWAYQLAIKEAMLEAESVKGQLMVNAAEARSKRMWVAGWRPTIGWVCALSFAWQFFVQPLFTYVLIVAGVDIPPLPTFDNTMLNTVLMGMLGLGAFRSYEKVRGIRSGVSR